VPRAAKIKPTHRAVKAYYETLARYGDQHVGHETAIRSAFQTLLADTARTYGWMLIPELGSKTEGRTIRPDGTLRDGNSLPRGYWEAKDTADDLDAEIVKKAAKGYSLANTIFEDTRTAVLFQGKREVLRVALQQPQQLCDLLNQLYSYTEPDIGDFEQAIDEFKQRVPELARGLADIIRDSHDSNSRFQAAFDGFFTLCQTALNPNIARAAVDEMLIQHLLTERLIRKVFDNPEFTQRNVIAAEVEKVIAALVSKAFNRDEFLRSLDRFYVAIEHAARRCSDWNEKQHFLNTVYERFFQGYSVKVADTHGIIYTPQPIVNFMCASVAEVLQTEFGVSLTDKSVHILDPCTGTANFIVNLLRRMPQRDLPRMYREQLFANEVMLLPYYIAALNIEHAYYELTGTYEPFEGLCFVDTLDLAESRQAGFSFMTQANTQRVERQKKAPITVIIGNPPYNAAQLNENDNNKNRKYSVVDARVAATYAKASRATLKAQLYDPYVKFFRWAVDRLGPREGIVCFVSNNSFIDQLAFDGMRKHILQDFAVIYHVDLHGNVRRNPKLSGTTHNVFGIQVGVGITLAIRRPSAAHSCVKYRRVPENWRREEKLRWLQESASIANAECRQLRPDADHNWLVSEHADQFRTYLRLGDKAEKVAAQVGTACVFKCFCGGVKTNRDDVVYDFRQTALGNRMRDFVEAYNSEVDRYKRQNPRPEDIDAFVDYARLKWDGSLKLHLQSERYAGYDPSRIREALYRPFTTRYLYFDGMLINRRYLQQTFYPKPEVSQENRSIWLKVGSEWPPFALAVDKTPDLLPQGGSQCFPFYVYNEDGSNRRENITDWALKLFREHYQDPAIEKWDIFYYVYGVLHHPGYREKFADNLKRELPRIPLAPPVESLAGARGSEGPPTGVGGSVGRGSDQNPPRQGPARTRAGAERPPTCVGGSDGPPTGGGGWDGPPTGGGGWDGPPTCVGGSDSGAGRGAAYPNPPRQGQVRPPTGVGGSERASGFWAFADAGKQLARWHLDYEQIEPYKLEFVEKKTVGDGAARGGRCRTIEDLYRVEDKMRLSKDKTALVVNPLLTLEGIPPECCEYRLGNRSALEWVIDQYQVTTDKRSGIHSDPNRPDDPEYIVRLVGQVIRVSLETVRLVKSLPEQYAGE
jgi:predicted helicase